MRLLLSVLLLCGCTRSPVPASDTWQPTAQAPTGVTGETTPATPGETGPTGGVLGPTGLVGPFTVTSVRVVNGTTIDVAFSHPPIALGTAKLTGVPVFSWSRTSDPLTLRLRTHDLISALTLEITRVEDAAMAVVSHTQTVNGSAPLGGVYASITDPSVTNEGPGVWMATATGVKQTSNAYGGSSTDRLDLNKPGTYYLHEDSLSDGVVQATLQNPDDDGMGLIARYVDSSHYYRFEWLSQGGVRRLVKIDGSDRKLMDFDVAPFVPGQAYRTRLAMVGTRLTVFIDDVLVLQASDSAFSSGRYGVYCWGSQNLVADGLLVAPASNASYPEWSDRFRPAAPILTHSPMVSEIDTTRAMVWVRTSEAAQVRALVSTSADMGSPSSTAVATTDDASDRTAELSISGLTPGTRYFLQVESRDLARTAERNLSPVRSFVTAAAPSVPVDFSFVWFGDVHDGAEARFVGFDSMAAAKPDFALALGDFPYADGDPVATTLAQYRWKHAVVRSIPALDGFIGKFPMYGVWDDHEVGNDWDGATSASRVANGVKVWHEWWPLRAHASAPANAIYRSVRYGNTAEIFLLDTRSQRPANSVAQSPSKSMLGAAQKAWLVAALAASSARFKIIVTSIPLRYGTTGNDHWEGYTHERTEILNALAGKSGVFFLTADQHWHAAHAHAEGFPEFQASSLSAGLRTPLTPKPAAVVYQNMVHGYGRVDIVGSGTDPHATVSLHDLQGSVLYSQTIR